MSNSWFRLYSEFLSDHKVQMMSEQYQRRLVMLFCLRCNADVTLRDSEIAFQLRINEVEWSETKAEFIKRGFIDSDNNLINWSKRQYRSDSSAERVRRHREAKRNADVTVCNVTVTPPDTDTDTDTDKKVNILVASNDTPPPNEIKIEKPKAKKPTRLPENWELEQHEGEWAEQQGLKYEEIKLQEAKFKDYWIGTGKARADWPATWRNWVRTVLEGRYKHGVR